MGKLRCKQKHVLIIDDEPAILKLISRILERDNFKVSTASCGESGINSFDSNSFDLVLTDIKMPGLSGVSVLEHIKSKTNGIVPVIGMSGTPWLLNHHNFNGILEKPFGSESLKKTIKNCF